jgi:hypothetical protein
MGSATLKCNGATLKALHNKPSLLKILKELSNISLKMLWKRYFQTKLQKSLLKKTGYKKKIAFISMLSRVTNATDKLLFAPQMLGFLEGITDALMCNQMGYKHCRYCFSAFCSCF